MEIRADFAAPATVTASDHEWVASPMAGVERVMLDRIGAEVARATSLVRYAPQSRFSAHTHDMGEEFLVLKGTFSDASGDFAPLSYVRNPPGTSHAPWSDEGCVIFVKLRQFADDDLSRVVVDIANGQWQSAGVAGADFLDLHVHESERVRVVRLQPGAHWRAPEAQEGGEEVLVLEGRLTDARGAYEPWSWLRNPPGHGGDWSTDDGALFYIKTGHLAGAAS